MKKLSKALIALLLMLSLTLLVSCGNDDDDDDADVPGTSEEGGSQDVTKGPFIKY